MKLLLLFSALMFTACSITEYAHTEPKIITIKSPKLKFSDLGYIRNSSENIELELFIAGQAIEKFTLNHLICTSDGCMSKSSFNSSYLNSSYPDETLQNILLSRPIYKGKNRVERENGFEQNIVDEHVDIRYVVTLQETYFKDRKNSIIFKIKDIDGK